ncbi:hypothetical protein AB0N07_13755 [Streptomyces sp. NPDC051172]|uniref:hypothetical protein n=1 Tax=Streptomyces sp. NPDC051172 TaxID=3155796 RepID=UPI0034478D04
MPDTVHALLVATDGTITDLHLSTNDTVQRTQVHHALGDDAEALRYIHGADSSRTVALAPEVREDQRPNPYAALALYLLLDEAALIADVQGPVIFAGFTQQDLLTDLSEKAVNTIRIVEPDAPGGVPSIVRTGGKPSAR